MGVDIIKAFTYRGGNICRGFITHKFYLSEIDTMFIDINTETVNNAKAISSRLIFDHAYAAMNGIKH